jgi:CubicO group peptidase (beta-lactamase class C family)
MKYILTIFLATLFTTIYGQHGSDSLTHKLDVYFTAHTNLKNFNGNVLIAKNDVPLLNKTYNILNENDSLKIFNDSRFIMASVSKVFIKFAILKLTELKKVKLTDALSNYIPDCPNGEKITVEHLMSHQSGLPRELTNYKDYAALSLKNIVEVAKKEKLQFEPGTQSLYSNVGYFILHYIIDISSKKGYYHFIETEILSKMKLSNTGEYNSTAQIPHFAYGFDRKDGKIMATPQASINRFETGNYFTTIDDLYTFSQQILSGKVLKKETALKMFDQDSLLIQAGGRSGYRAYFYKNKKTCITFLFLSNYTDMPFQSITEDVIKILNGESYTVPHKIERKAIKLPEEILKRYLGKFALEIDTKQVFTTTLNNEKLIFTDSDGNRMEMNAEDEFNFFEDPDSKNIILFTFNEQTKKYDLVLLTEGIKLKTRRIE